MVKKDKIHYSFRKVDSYDKKYNFIISPRCLGKSTAMINKIYKHFRKYNKPTVVLRRRTVDITSAYIDSIEGIINKFLPDDRHITFTYAKGNIKEGVCDVFIGKQLFIRIVSLSVPKERLKSLYIKDIYCIFMDEYIIDCAAGEKYLVEEAKRFREIYLTFAREGDDCLVKAYFCGNPYSVYSPILDELTNVDTGLLYPGNFIVGKNYVIDVAQPSQELIDWLIKKGLYDPEEDDEYSKYAFLGQAVNDAQAIIVKDQPEGYTLKFVFKLQRKTLLVFTKGDICVEGGQKFWITVGQYQGGKTSYAIDFNNLLAGSRMLVYEDRLRLSNFKRAMACRNVSFSSLTSYYLTLVIYQNI